MKEKNIIEVAKKLRNQKAKEWRDKNKEKVRQIHKRYWEKKAQEYLANNNKNNC